MVDKFVVHPNDIKRLESYYAYIMTLGILRSRKGQESKRPLIYNKKIEIDYCGINDSKFTIDTSRITRQAKVANMSDVEFNVFRKMTWNSHKQKYNLNGECPNNFIPTKEIYVEQGVK